MQKELRERLAHVRRRRMDILEAIERGSPLSS
jgi:hypothetical protein